MLIRARLPDLFHGHKKKSNFFEGWYFKIVDSTQRHVFAIIPGIILGKGTEASHSFIQFVHGQEAYFRYLSFPVESFQAQKNTFAVAVDHNSFSLQNISLNMEEGSLAVRGDLNFRNVIPWPDTFLNPGSMGFYNYIPRISSRASLTCSLAHIPFLWGSFRGFLIGLKVGKQFYSFTTMNRSHCRIGQTGEDIHMEVQNSRHILTLETGTSPGQFILLHGPRDGGMVPLVQENLQGRVRVELKEQTGKVLFADEGACAGIEYGGQQMLVLDRDGQLEENIATSSQ